MNLVMNKKGGDIYKHFEKCLEDYINNVKDDLKIVEREKIPEAIAKLWNKYTKIMNEIIPVMRYVVYLIIFDRMNISVKEFLILIVQLMLC